MLNASAAAAGFDHALLWGLHDFLDGVRGQRGLELALSRESVGRVEQLRQHQKRPYCATFKMVALLHAMQRLSGEGDYVLWADSQRSSQLAALPAPAAGNIHSRRHRDELNEGARDAPRSIYGRISCVRGWAIQELAVPIRNAAHPELPLFRHSAGRHK